MAMIRNATAALLLSTSLVGCMGHNGLTDRVLEFNLSAAENRWAREGLFLGMWVIPVYPICTLVDIFALNSVEFWSGKNPVNGRRPVVDIPRSEIEKLGLEAVEVAWVERLSEGRAALHVAFENGDRVTFDVLREGDGYVVSYAGVEFFGGRIAL
jgi:hypothetical protein